MNKDILQGKWTQIKGTIKETWGKLTDDEIEQIRGNYDQLLGVVQEKYGYTREEAEREIDKYLSRVEASQSSAR